VVYAGVNMFCGLHIYNSTSLQFVLRVIVKLGWRRLRPPLFDGEMLRNVTDMLYYNAAYCRIFQREKRDIFVDTIRVTKSRNILQ